ncbi:site-specific DNA-methyltransferase [Streptococcus uberis]|uniref:site-specific DNA-methyltransferase n=1 Tax=Streptococcus uberis TaxID=1349 RepID=UPI0012B6456F|nr:site-specific DNA-methyltransferase [Streptococcus uberis]MTB58871.1 site-specific DNA-methyltransferase [Streptococcus uberis]MTC00162.1 site-specific DNA-methyltransferase [Streptococcus uberis]
MTQYGDHTGVEKLQLLSKDWTSDHVAKIAELFPQVITESQDKHGRLRKAIDFDKLKDILSFDLAEGRETYEFTWVGKRDAMAEAGRPTTKTLRPDLAESVNFDESENVFITGDNLEVLKILQESYLNKIDMIYIDPPYNTGKDFVYSDKFQMSQEEMDEATESLDETGKRLVKNEKSNARYHSDWLNMMYPRLVLARNLLKDTGVIFISIDDNEQANLKALCEEVFGEGNFVALLPIINNLKGNNDQFAFSGTHEYCYVYCKNKELLKIFELYLDSKELESWETDEFGIFKQGANLKSTGINAPREKRPNLFFPLYVNQEKVRLEPFEESVEIYPITNGKEMSWRWSKEKFSRESYNLIVKEQNGEYSIYKKQRNSDSERPTKKPKSTFMKPEYSSGNGSSLMKKLFQDKVFDFPKSLQLIIDFLTIGTRGDAIILDFFAGSATTADAVMQLNTEDGGNRKYILCTLDEAVADKSVAKEAGYDTIDQISRERIRRAADKIRTENPEKAQNLDFGFKAFKLATSNFKDVYQSPEQYQQVNLLDNISNIKDDRNDLDLLFQVMLTWGMELSLSVKKEQLTQSVIYNVAENALIACFAEDITEDVIRQIAQKEPLRAVFKDSSFANSADKINLSQIFKEVSPMTKVKVI